MIRLNYTDEMRFQDHLWQTEGEDLEVMKELYEEIVRNAREHGFEGSYLIYDGSIRECVIDIYMNEDEERMAESGYLEDRTFGYCKPLIECLEYELNGGR